MVERLPRVYPNVDSCHCPLAHVCSDHHGPQVTPCECGSSTGPDICQSESFETYVWSRNTRMTNPGSSTYALLHVAIRGVTRCLIQAAASYFQACVDCWIGVVAGVVVDAADPGRYVLRVQRVVRLRVWIERFVSTTEKRRILVDFEGLCGPRRALRDPPRCRQREHRRQMPERDHVERVSTELYMIVNCAR